MSMIILAIAGPSTIGGFLGYLLRSRITWHLATTDLRGIHLYSHFRHNIASLTELLLYRISKHNKSHLRSPSSLGFHRPPFSHNYKALLLKTAILYTSLLSCPALTGKIR